MSGGLWQIYHTGLLCSDRVKDEDLDRLARRLLDRARLGLVVLTQRKLENLVYEYMVASSRSG